VLAALVAAGAQAAEPPTAAPLLPKDAAVKPARPRRLLIFNLCTGFRHGVIPFAARTVEQVGRETGAFESVSTEDIALFEPERLKDFDAVFLNNTCGELFLPKDLAKLPAEAQGAARARDARLRQGLADFVKGGKGLAGNHAAAAAFYRWPEFGEMLGAYFQSHGWGAFDAPIKVDDPKSPLTAMFDPAGFQIKEEIYLFADKASKGPYYFERQPYSRQNLHVLLSINTSKMDAAKAAKGGRADGDYGISWVRRWGRGRIFYTAFGHSEAIFRNERVLRHILAGLQFVLGDLEADAAPSAAAGKEGV
jgi:hypothetical protein